MKITKVYLKNFKRFTELEISGIPTETKLIVLAGPNGCGKSSIFDAFEQILNRNKGVISEEDYLRKDKGQPWTCEIETNKGTFGNNKTIPSEKNALYIRSPYRVNPQFNVSQISSIPDMLDDQDRPKRTIDLDHRITSNYQRLNWILFKEWRAGNKTGKESQKQFEDKLNNILEKVLDIRLSDLGDPTDGQGQLYFRKGVIEKFPFKNLSSGEKEVIDMIIDLIVKVEKFNDTIFCIDEPDLHLNTSIQAKLLEEILNLIPENSQLWISTHSLGFIEEATKSSNVAIIDFGEKNFDIPQTLKPLEKTKEHLRRIYHVALENLVDFVISERIIFCEGESQDSDEKLYKSIFDKDSEFRGTEFISSKSGLQAKAAVLSVLEPINRGLSPKKAIAIIDRDYRTDSLLNEHRGSYIKILKMYSLENYLLHPNNIKNFKEVDAESYKIFLIQKINEKLDELKGKIKRMLENIKNEKVKQRVKQEVETNNKLLKSDSIIEGNFSEIYPYIPIKELLSEIVDWYNNNYRNNREQYSKDKFLEELTQVFASDQNNELYKDLKEVFLL